MLTSQKYVTDIATLRDYGGEKLKLSVISCQLNPAFENEKKYSAKNSVNEEKLDNNIVRARQKILEYCYCNDFNIFFTGTLNPDKWDRHDLVKFQSVFSRFIRHQRKKYGIQIDYVLIPEQHEDGAWHLHGFFQIQNLENISMVRQFSLKEKLPKYIRDKIKAGFTIYDWPEYSKKFGFCDLEYIQNREARANYVTKYVTKALAETTIEVGGHLYYPSRGLKTAEVIAKGQLQEGLSDFDFANQYCKIAWRDNIDLQKNNLLKKFR